jgi:steroid 5-alpha reductase family enzyme
MLIVSTPLYLAQFAATPDHLSLIEILAGMIAAFGILFEAIADWQLYRFKSDPANQGKVFDRGLWRFSRHPNYFGEMLVWWGLFGLALSAPYGWLGLISPIVMTIFLLKVSGVTLLERDLKESKPAYRDYINATNAFIPWLPKSS